jgi:hypothetical protein
MLLFREMRDSMYRRSNQAHDRNELQATIWKPKSRHQISQMARRVASWLSVRRIRCQIFTGEHGMNECQHFPELGNIRSENSRLETDSRKHMCRVHFGFRAQRPDVSALPSVSSLAGHVCLLISPQLGCFRHLDLSSPDSYCGTRRRTLSHSHEVCIMVILKLRICSLNPLALRCR